MSRREYLGIYIYAHPKNEMEREFNNDIQHKAEAIRCIRVHSLINQKFGFLDKQKMKADFFAYFAKMMKNQRPKNVKQLKHTEHKVSLNSAAGYYSTFSGLLKIACRDKLLRENINDLLEKIEYGT